MPIADYATDLPHVEARGYEEFDRSDLWPGLLERVYHPSPGRHAGGGSCYGFRLPGGRWATFQARFAWEAREAFEGELVDSLTRLDAEVA